MSTHHSSFARSRARWSAIGAAVAVTLGAGGIGLAQAAVDSGDKPVTVTVDARRILDTRDNVGLAGAFVKNTPREVQVTGAVTVVADTPSGTATETVVPAGATAVLVNVTVAFPTDQGFLTLRAAGASGEPKTSTVNFAAGSVEPNAATVDLSADGKIQIWVFMPSAAAEADVLVDVVGYTVDHDHDDRYYSKAQTDAAVASAAAPKANTADVYTQVEVDDAVSALEGKLDEAGGVAFVRNGPEQLVNTAVAVLAELAIDVPVAGGFVATASAAIADFPGGTSLRCGLSTSPTTFFGQDAYFTAGGLNTVAMTRGFDVPAGQSSIYFICKRDNPGDDVTIFETNLTGVYSAFKVN